MQKNSRGYKLLQIALTKTRMSSEAELPSSSRFTSVPQKKVPESCSRESPTKPSVTSKAPPKSSCTSTALSEDLYSSDERNDPSSNESVYIPDLSDSDSAKPSVTSKAPPKSSCTSTALFEDLYSSDEKNDLSSNGSVYIPDLSDSDSVISTGDGNSDCNSIEYPALQNTMVTSCQLMEDTCSQTEQPVLQDATVGNSLQEKGVCAMTEQTKPIVTQQSIRRGKYKWDKKHCCNFCGKMVEKMSKHLQKMHSDETEVARIMAMEKGSIQRRQAFIALQDEGDFQHNFKVLEQNSGTLIPKYRKKEASNVDDFVACSFCKALYNVKHISLHDKKCPQNPHTESAMRKGKAAKQGRLMLPIPIEVPSAFYHRVIAKLKRDDICQLIKNDNLILLYGQRLFHRRDIEEHSSGQINSRLRELGRLLKVLRQRSNMKVSDLNAAISAASFDQIVEAIKELAMFDENTNQFKKGNLAMRLGHALKKCSQIKQSEATKRLGLSSDEEWQKQLQEAQRFDAVFSGDWFDSISATAAQSIGRCRMNKPKLIPSCEDVMKVQKLLKEEMQSNHNVTAVKATLCAISLFNRKRGGEVQRMKLADYKDSKLGPTQNGDLLQGLTVTEVKMVEYFHRIEIRGKFNRPVPILLTKHMMANLDRIVMLRKEIPALADSPYIFATPSGERPYRGHIVLKDYACKAEVSNCNFFTFTQLRKQVATLSQAMAISELEQDQLATFLGHDIRVFRHIYRQPQEILQKAKVAKILLAANRGMTDFESLIQEELDEDINFEEVEDEQKETMSRKRSHTVTLSKTAGDEAHEATQQKRSQAQSRNVEDSDWSDEEAPTKKPKFHRKPWTQLERKAIDRNLHAFIISGKLPGKAKIEKVISAEASLKHRNWQNIKDFVRNEQKKRKNQGKNNI